MTVRQLSVFFKGKKVFELERDPEDFNPKDISFLIVDKENNTDPYLLVKKYNVK